MRDRSTLVPRDASRGARRPLVQSSRPRRAPRALLAALAFVVPLFVGACSDDSANADATRRAEALANATTLLVDGAVRQPIPVGIDPSMVTWRSDGVLIASQDSLEKAPGYVVDSVFPPDEALRRFKAEIPGAPVTALSGGAQSVDSLLRRYWQLLSAGDTVALTPLVASKAEFAYLYFPESNEPADGMQPSISWLLLSNNGGRGLTRSLAAATSAPGEVRGTLCTPNTHPVGQSLIHGPCGIVRERASGVDTLWIATHIIERDGIFKLMSFTNEL